MATETADADEWETEYSDRFAYKRRRGDDTIKVKRPHTAADDPEWNVIGRIDGQVYHYTYAREDEAMRQVAVLEELAIHSVEYEVGEEVYVVSADFDTVVQRGVVAYSENPEDSTQASDQRSSDNNDQYNSIRVRFPEDPYSGKGEGRTIDVDPDETLHAHAGTVEVLSFIGREDLLELSDF